MSISRLLCILAGGFLLFTLSRGIVLLSTRSPEPRIEVTPTEVNLGRVLVGQPVERTFLIRNTGTARLLITDVKSSCQCTVAHLASRAVAPGSSVKLRVTLNARKAGTRLQGVTIATNDPQSPIRIIGLKAYAVAATQP